MSFNPKFFVAIALVGAALLAAILSYQSESRFQQQLISERVDQEALLAPPSQPEETQQTVQVFYPGQDTTRAGQMDLLQEDHLIPGQSGPAALALEMARAALTRSSHLVGPQAGITQVFILDNGTAVVDLARGTSIQLTGSVSTELALLRAIARSITTNLEEIDQVRFLIGGREVPSLGGHISLAGPFR